MGNSASGEQDAVKKQAEGGSVPMYGLVDLKGGGLLFHIAKRAIIKKEFKELDEAIKSKVTPYLYNGGKGAMVPIAQLSLMRNRYRSSAKQLPVIKELGSEASNFVFEGSEVLERLVKGLNPEKSPQLFRECCWMVEKRGSVSETLLHVCFLLQTPTHLMLARRLLKWYPKLILDVYLADEYYGENVLHMSIVAEDPTMVKSLLEVGVNIEERFYGNLVCPEDQKSSRNDCLEHEEVDVCLKTNYQGYFYLGEYPLSFAAVLNQVECYRLILSRGADHDLQDTNGNSVTHILVIHDNIPMFDMAVECGASINILNKQQLTPLSMSSFLAKKEMFFHIANIEREVYWQIGNVTCSAYPIAQLDSIDSKTGELNPVSALNLIVFGNKVEHLDLIEGIIVDILRTKWKSFIKQRFYRQLLLFTIYFVISFIAFHYRPECISVVGEPKCKQPEKYSNESESFILNGTNIGNSPSTSLFKEISDGVIEFDTSSTALPKVTLPGNGTNSSSVSCRICPRNKVYEQDKCYLNRYQEFSQMVRVSAEVIIVIWSLVYIGIAVREATFLPFNIFLHCMSLCPSRVLFLFACILIQIMVALRVTCQPEYEDVFATLVMFLVPLYFLFFCRGIKLTGPFVTMIYRMIATDLLRFALIYLIFVLGFSQSYFIIFKSFVDPNATKNNDKNPMTTAMDSILENFQLSLGANLGNLWKKFRNTDYEYAAKIHCCIFLMVIFVMLINLLIAMMSDTYTKIAEIKNEWIRQWAKVILLLERGIPPQQRLIQQDIYSERMATGEKALILKQTLSVEELDEIKHIIEMKKSHRQSINRRRELFGFESNSTIGLSVAKTL